MVKDTGGQPAFTDNVDKADTLNWEQVREREAERGTASGCQWRSKPAEARVKVVKSTLRRTLLEALGEEEPTPNYKTLHCPDDGGRRG